MDQDKDCGVGGRGACRSPRLRYDHGREAVQEDLSSTRRTARIVGMLVLGGLERRCAGSSAKGDDHHGTLGVQPMNRVGE